MIILKTHCDFDLFIDLKDQYWDAAAELQRENSYPYEMMPLLYAIIKSTKGNFIEAHRLIQEGRTAVHNNESSKNHSGDDELVYFFKHAVTLRAWIRFSIILREQ